MRYGVFWRIINAISNPAELSQEAFDAYIHRLPGIVRVSWRKDGDDIVGHVTVDEKDFFTQAKTPDELVVMVNDAVYTAYDIPDEYRRPLSQIRAYRPNKDAWDQLKRLDPKYSSLEFEKKLQIAK